jgi:hypothetical protein
MGACAALGQTAPGGLSPGEVAQRRAEYEKLNRQIYVRHLDSESQRIHIGEPQRVAAISDELHGILTGAIVQVLSSPRLTVEVVQDAVRQIQGDLAPWTGGPGSDTNTPLAQFFELNGDQYVAVGFGTLEGNEDISDSQSVLEFFVKRNNAWKVQADTGSEFRSYTFFLSPISAGVPGESWYVAWGQRYGDNGARLKACLYGFNGNGVRTIWERDGLTGGQINVSPTSVTLDYYKEYHSLEMIHEVLHITPNGLQ